MSGVVAFEGELNSIVKEYLHFSNFERTLTTFQDECDKKGKPVARSESVQHTNQQLLAVQQELLALLDSGCGEEFVQLWQATLSEKIRNEDQVAQKLEFYIHVYFAIYPLKFANQRDSDMTHLRSYLESRGAALSQTTEFLPFYALPFVPDPRAHPSYRELFADKWAADLRVRLEKFLTLALKSIEQPKLFELYKGGENKNWQSLAQQVNDSQRKTAAYMKRYNRVQSDYHSLIGITADLVESLEATVQGDPVSPEYLQQICQRLFGNQMRESVDLSRPGTAAEVLRQSIVPPQGLNHQEAAPVTSLDYNKIRLDITNEDERTVALLLQALRWKLTKSTPAERDAIMADYIRNDLLGCAKPGQYRDKILSELIADSELIRQYMARLFNSFASLCDGRTYLSQNPALMKALLGTLRSDDRDSLTRENVLGCLQKLSLRRALQSLMVEEGIIGWLVIVLEDNDSLSDYTLEYSIALLMNLCLRTAGKYQCKQVAHQVLKVLSDLLGHENQEIIPYVNGTLYSILAMSAIREEAKAMGLEENLRCFIKDDQHDMNRQIEFIIKQLNSSEDPDMVNSEDEDDEDDEEDQDAMETDLDKSELLRLRTGELNGDRLLNTEYTTTASQSPTHRKRRVTDSVFDEVLQRPVTPSQMRPFEAAAVHVTQHSRPASSRVISRPASRGVDLQRPATSSGSRPSSTQDTSRVPPPVAIDESGSEVVAKVTGSNKSLALATDSPSLKPSTKALEKLSGNGGSNLVEYQAAFGSRPRIVRTPGAGRPTSCGSVGDGPTPQPTYSESLPTPRPTSGGRATGISLSETTTSPSPRVVKSKASRNAVN